MESNETKLRVIRRALSIWSDHGNDNLIIEGDSINVITSASSRKDLSWKLINIVSDIGRLGITFTHTAQSTNSIVDFLVKIGVQRRQPSLEFFYL